MVQRRSFLCVAAAGAVLGPALAPTAHAAADYPNRPINVIVPYAPGGVTDSLSRQVAEFLRKHFKQTVTVENRPGAGATLGGKVLAGSKPDGYTIGIFDATAMTVTPQLYRKPPYETPKAFQPITRLGNNYQVVLSTLAAPVKTLPEFVEFARRNEGLSVSTPGAIGINSIEFARFAQLADFRSTNVGYNGSLPLLQDLMAGHTQFAFTDVASSLPYVTSGKIRALAVTSRKRLDLLPDIPTVAESGYPDYEAIAWFGAIAPVGLPDDILRKLDEALQAFGRSAAYQKWAIQNSFFPDVSASPEAFRQAMLEEIERYTTTAKRLNLSLD